jgi:hypothetical protein
MSEPLDILDTPEARRWAMKIRTRLLSQRTDFSPEEAEALRAVNRAKARLAAVLAEGLVRDTPDS